MNFPIEDIRAWITTIVAATALGGVVWGWMTAGRKDNSVKLDKHDADIADLRTDVGGLRGDINSIRQEMEHMPSKDAVHQIELMIAQLNGSIEAISKSVESSQRTTSRIEKYLLEAKS